MEALTIISIIVIILVGSICIFEMYDAYFGFRFNNST